MKFDKQNLMLYAVTDRSWLGEKTLFQQVEEALQGGVTCYSYGRRIWMKNHLWRRLLR